MVVLLSCCDLLGCCLLFAGVFVFVIWLLYCWFTGGLWLCWLCCVIGVNSVVFVCSYDCSFVFCVFAVMLLLGLVAWVCGLFDIVFLLDAWCSSGYFGIFGFAACYASSSLVW